MTWAVFGQLADVLGDVGTAVVVFWLIRIEVRLKRLEIMDKLWGAVIASDPDLIAKLREAARWKLL